MRGRARWNPPAKLSIVAADDLNVRLVFFTLEPNLWSLFSPSETERGDLVRVGRTNVGAAHGSLGFRELKGRGVTKGLVSKSLGTC